MMNMEMAMSWRELLGPLQTIQPSAGLGDWYAQVVARTVEQGPFEPPRLSRRLQLLRGWSHEDDDEVLPGSPRASGSTGIGTSRQPRVGMGSDLLDFCQDRLYRRNTAPLGTPGRARYWQT